MIKREYRINYKEMVKWLTCLFLGSSISAMGWHDGKTSVAVIVLFFGIALVASIETKEVGS